MIGGIMNEKDIKILDRSYRFALRIINLVREIPHEMCTEVLARQIIRSGTSIGANVEEAIAGYSKAEFTHKMSIALREARETQYWLRLIHDSRIMNPSRFDSIIRESEEIKRILGAIVHTSRLKK